MLRCAPVGHTACVRSRFLILLVVAGAVLAASGSRLGAAPDTSTTTVVLVRHAEKDTHFVGADQPLNAAGVLRAEELARVLGDVSFSAIFTTPWSRSRKTAEPLARHQGDSLTVVDAIDRTVQGIRQHAGGTVLVVGHSNTIPQIIAALTGRSELESLAVRYDDLFVLTLVHDHPPRLLRLHYGAPSSFAR